MKRWHKVCEEFPAEEGIYTIATKRGHVGYVVLEDVTPQNPWHLVNGDEVIYWQEMPEHPHSQQ